MKKLFEMFGYTIVKKSWVDKITKRVIEEKNLKNLYKSRRINITKNVKVELPMARNIKEGDLPDMLVETEIN